MPQLSNRSPYATSLLVVPNRNAIETLVVIVKGTFQLSSGVLSAAQVPIAEADVWAGEPGASALRVAHDLALEKLGTDVLLIGEAMAAEQRAVTDIDVGIRVGALHKRLRVSGERRWQRTLWGVRPSAPLPFTSVPLTWDLAFGGTAADPAGDEPAHYEPRNPVGRGLRHPRDPQSAIGTLLPHIEADEPLRRLRDCPPPAGCQALAPSWQPRAGYAGTYDAAWSERRAPFLPLDFDPRFFQVAPSDQIVNPPLRGGEAIQLSGVSSVGEMVGRVPHERPTVTVHAADGGKETLSLMLDTLVLIPNDDCCTVVWRGNKPLPQGAFQVSEIVIEAIHG